MGLQKVSSSSSSSKIASPCQVVLKQGDGLRKTSVNVQVKDSDSSRRNTIDLQIGEGRSRKNTLVKVNGEVVSRPSVSASSPTINILTNNEPVCALFSLTGKVIEARK
ncbi:unnamed protein product [Caenorhabditis auriculariae]|uniref:Uncharacterized protein n=1 Tax=Caenorhabditis auriculariae TaxID=2777116 RepID=A0A8S1H3G0_9PELO|nr:unnamed protein product [Caenorhabditis auriculariae]